MSKNTLELLVLALRAKNKKKVLPYLRRAVQELTTLIQEVEESNVRRPQGAPEAQGA